MKMLSLALAPFVISGVFAASGCGTASPYEVGQLSDNQTVLDTRRYRVFVPPSYDQSSPTPLILSYHGANGYIESQVALDRLTDPFFNTENIVVYLQGNADDADRPTHTTWEGAPENASDDYGFTAAVLDAVEADLCVDTARVYATGKSQGGGFVGRLACHPTLSQRIAAFAPVSGAYYIDSVDLAADCRPAAVEIPCNPGREGIPILAFHGGDDPTISYEGGFQSGMCLPAVRHWAEAWVARDAVAGLAVENSSIAGSDNGVKTVFGGGLVTLVYDGDNIGHDWPSTLTNADNKGSPKTSFNGTEWILEWFQGWTLPS